MKKPKKPISTYEYSWKKPRGPHLVVVVYGDRTDGRLKEAGVLLLDGPIPDAQFEEFILKELGSELDVLEPEEEITIDNLDDYVEWEVFYFKKGGSK